MAAVIMLYLPSFERMIQTSGRFRLRSLRASARSDRVDPIMLQVSSMYSFLTFSLKRLAPSRT
jgi:hypothetical protein